MSSYPNGIQITQPRVVAQAATLGRQNRKIPYPERVESILNSNRGLRFILSRMGVLIDEL
jgi:hypothetical protein